MRFLKYIGIITIFMIIAVMIVAGIMCIVPVMAYILGVDIL